MVQFSKFKMLFAMKQKFNGGQLYKEISKIGYFQKFEKSQNKVAVAEEIGFGNDIVLCKIGWGNEMRQNKTLMIYAVNK